MWYIMPSPSRIITNKPIPVFMIAKHSLGFLLKMALKAATTSD